MSLDGNSVHVLKDRHILHGVCTHGIPYSSSNPSVLQQVGEALRVANHPIGCFQPCTMLLAVLSYTRTREVSQHPSAVLGSWKRTWHIDYFPWMRDTGCLVVLQCLIFRRETLSAFCFRPSELLGFVFYYYFPSFPLYASQQPRD